MTIKKIIIIEETFYTAEQAANLLSSTKKVIEKKLRAGEVKGSKRLGKWFILRSDIIAYIEEGKI